ncbi:MAG: endonuclease domain-containing protein, partial [Thermoproteota archaeon]|nr:endonuclease domain-containing protein [Thermoproteota archaeon]
MSDQQKCQTCGNKQLLRSQKYCRKCASDNPYYDPSNLISYNNSQNQPRIKRSEPTKYAVQLARALHSKGIKIQLEPEIWYTSCNFYTPDILVNEDLIVEVDGPYHEEPQIKKNDRIRQRALENSGYPVYRFKNEEIVNSLDYVVDKIKSVLYEFEHNSDKKTAPKLIEMEIPETQRMSNVPEYLIKAYSIALNSTLVGKMEKWSTSYFKEFLSQYDPTPVGNRCAMERILFILLGLNLHLKKEPQSTIDFEHYSMLFDKSIGIMKGLFGETAEIELKNAYNITATNFMKNLIFYGKPLIARIRIVWIKDYESIVFHISEFKKYFYRFGIYVEESEVKVECLGELDKIENILKERNKIKQQISQNQIGEGELRRFGWLERWIQDDIKCLHWL